MRPASGKKFVFVQREPLSHDLTPEKRPQQKRQSEAPRNDRHGVAPHPPTSNTRLHEPKNTAVPPPIPKHRKPVDVLKYANDIVERARKVDTDGTKEQRQPSPKQEPTQSRKMINQPAQSPFPVPSKQPVKPPPEQPEPAANRPSAIQQRRIAQNPPPPASRDAPRPNEAQKQARQQQLRQKELLSKIDFLQEQVHSSTKDFQQLQSKYNTLVKDHKNCSKEIKRLADALKEKEAAVVKLLQSDSVPYQRKRQCILQNQLRSLRDYNRQLVLRLKAYKSSELAEMAVQFNKQSILNDYVKEQPGETDGKLELENLAYQLMKDLDGYAISRAKKKLSFADQQKQLMALQHSINTFCMNCMVQGLRVPEEQCQPLPSVEASVKRECSSTTLLDSFGVAVRNTEFNLKVCRQLDMMMEDQRQLSSFLQKNNVRKVLEECFNVKGKRPADIARTVEERLLVYADRHSRMNFVLLATVVSTLSRLDTLTSYVTQTIGKLQSQLKRLTKPLDDLHSLYEHGGDSNDEAYRQKLARFVRSNIQQLRLSIPAAEQHLASCLIDFNKLKTLL